jgi:hypothetical protein
MLAYHTKKETYYQAKHAERSNGTFRSNLALEAMKEKKTLPSYPVNLGSRRKQRIKELPSLLSDRHSNPNRKQEELRSELC